jgi:hypothetical protein
MPHPLIVGGLVMGGAVAAWRLMRERGRMRGVFRKLMRESADDDPGNVVRLERDPSTGVYAPRKKT